MAKPKVHRLGDVQLKIMKALWARREATVADVHAALSQEREVAYTTVATMLRKMEGRGLVSHSVDGRAFIYRPRFGAAEVSRGMTEHFLNRLFEGSLSEAVAHLLTSREVRRDELEELERLIAARKKKL